MLSFLNRNMVLVTFNGCLFEIEAIFGKICMSNLFMFIVKQKMVIKNHVLSIESFCQKDSTWTLNKQVAITCLIDMSRVPFKMGAKFQHSNCQFWRQKSERNPSDVLEWEFNYWKKNICYIGKIPVVKNLLN